MVHNVPINALQTAAPFDGLLPIKPETLAAIEKNIRERGFDPAQPIVVWRAHGLVVDGHTRMKAAVKVGLVDVPVVLREFRSEDEALDYALHAQRARRNLTDAEILHLVQVLDTRRARGGDRRSPDARARAGNTPPVSSADETAKRIGTSASKIGKARAVLAADGTAAKADVESGAASLNQASRMVREAKRTSKPGADASARARDFDSALQHLAQAREHVRRHESAIADSIGAIAERVQECLDAARAARSRSRKGSGSTDATSGEAACQAA